MKKQKNVKALVVFCPELNELALICITITGQTVGVEIISAIEARRFKGLALTPVGEL